MHPSTLEIFGELGWLDDFFALPHNTMPRVQVAFGGHEITVADFTKLSVRCPFIAFVPQWDLLTFLAEKASQYPHFTLLNPTEVTGLSQRNGVVTGVIARRGDQSIRIDADLIIGADGRNSITREAADLPRRESKAPIDVFWLRLPRRESEEIPLFTGGRGSLVSINRGDYWQLAYAVPHVSGQSLRTDGVGINLAIQDAVATANHLGPILATRKPTSKELDQIRRRRNCRRAWPRSFRPSCYAASTPTHADTRNPRWP